ncbi:MAG: 3-keto-disaccharide hydrolase [Chitinophagaceae bacterium]
MYFNLQFLNRIIIVSAIHLISYQVVAQTKLFNGIDLTGWQINGTEKWYVENGELICESGSDKEYGYLTTNKFYKNFILKLEFKQEANGNSGVFFRSTVKGTVVRGWQVEVAPSGQHTGGIYESYGRGWLIKPDSASEKYLKMGEWNKMKIHVEGDRVVTYLNGHQMVSIKDEKIGIGEGGIALQIHSGGGIKVRWRNIQLKEL